MEDYQSDAGGGKMKTRKTKRVCLYPQVSEEKGGEKSLDFKVLSLEEIRRRKRRKVLQDRESKDERVEKSSAERGKSSAEFLKDAVKTLNQLKGAISGRGVKRALEDEQEDSDRRKVKCNTDRTGTAVGSAPPVKLRRSRESPKRFASFAIETEELRNAERADREEKIEERQIVEVNPAERLDSSETMESSTLSRKSEVEVRLCDSSTDEDQASLEKSDERKSVGVYSSQVEDSKETCDSLLNIQEDEYLTLDMASDDILKDIDALLKEKSTV